MRGERPRRRRRFARHRAAHPAAVADRPAGGHRTDHRQIGERLLLSARTIGFHLYQTYPKLGITNRAQLRDALSGTGPSQ
ncbi:LuxR C-terminal-related transcriptional regulator [Streptomyces sp. WSLK1-3]|uniref:LuxR C-terminal-related transcriptional regulator n=1 Tax=Streptomyces sp. WSLK1-3 TaxID=3375475 RepID=UPI0037B6B72A